MAGFFGGSAIGGLIMAGLDGILGRPTTPWIGYAIVMALLFIGCATIEKNQNP
jgi:hypothetical protein